MVFLLLEEVYNFNPTKAILGFVHVHHHVFLQTGNGTKNGWCYSAKNFIYSACKSEEEASSAGEQLASNKIYRLKWSGGSLQGSLLHCKSFQEFDGLRKLRTRSVLKVQIPLNEVFSVSCG